MCCRVKWLGGGMMLVGLLSVVAVLVVSSRQREAQARAEAQTAKDSKTAPTVEDCPPDLEAMLPNLEWKMPFKEDQPLYFVSRTGNAAEWDALKSFWNVVPEKTTDPVTGAPITRTAVKIKVPLGLTSNPPVPAENAMSVAKWKLGKRVYFDPVLSSDAKVSCATCHHPTKGYTDQLPVSVGIAGKLGGMNAPTVINSGYHTFQFWDGRASSLEDQAQGPVMNALEMFDGDGHAWRRAVERIRKQPAMVQQFKQVFGTLPTRDAVAKAIAAYERTVLSGNSIHDRAELTMRKRVDKEESNKYEILAKDYAAVLKAAFEDKDTTALKALQLDPAKDAGKIDETAKKLASGRTLFFNKARCSTCHTGDNFTDNIFHNLGVGVKDGKLPANLLGRYGTLPTGHKNPEALGAFKTPTVRALLHTAPYMHDGGEKTLEAVVDFYDRGGNVNEYLDVKMRDEEAEREWLKTGGKGYKGPPATVYQGRPIVPMKLNLTPQEKADLVLFLRALQGDPIPAVVADPEAWPK